MSEGFEGQQLLNTSIQSLGHVTAQISETVVSAATEEGFPTVAHAHSAGHPMTDPPFKRNAQFNSRGSLQSQAASLQKSCSGNLSHLNISGGHVVIMWLSCFAGERLEGSGLRVGDCRGWSSGLRSKSLRLSMTYSVAPKGHSLMVPDKPGHYAGIGPSTERWLAANRSCTGPEDQIS